MGNLLEYTNVGEDGHLHILLLLTGDIETNPGPQTDRFFKFLHWNLNSICARGGFKIPPLEAYNSVCRFDVMVFSETMLNSTVSNEEIEIAGFSKEINRNDHPSDTKTGGVCLYFREGLAIKRRKDLESLQEMIVTEITIARKKILFTSINRSLSQNSEQFENFINKLQITLSRMQSERPHSLILTGDFNCRSTQWRAQDVENPEGTALDELIETNNLHQLIDTPTNIRNEGMSCIDCIITDQPNLFVESGVNPSLDEHCQHQMIYGKLGVCIPPPPPYKRTVWDYAKSDTEKIKNEVNSTDWRARFAGLGPDEMTDLFTSNLYSILSMNIPNKTLKCNDKDGPLITPDVKTAIKRKHRVFKKFVDGGRREEDWKHVKEVCNETSK